MPSKSSEIDEVVVLKAGLSVSKQALDLAWDLEKRGHEVLVEKNTDRLLVSEDGLTEQQCSQIRRHKLELVALQRYVISTAVN